MNALPSSAIARTAIAVVLISFALFAMGPSGHSGREQAVWPQRTGVVRSPTGSPLGLVWVQELGTWNGRLTEVDGGFRFPADKPITLLFAKDGFMPKIWTTSASKGLGDLSIVMDLEPAGTISLRSCGRLGSGPLRELEPATTHGMQATRRSGSDFIAYSAKYITGGSVVFVSGSTGIHVAGLTPTPDWVAGLSSFTVRAFRCGGFQWIDLRGVSSQGLQSRWVGYPFGDLAYSRIPATAAGVLDKAIDNGCCR